MNIRHTIFATIAITAVIAVAIYFSLFKDNRMVVSAPVESTHEAVQLSDKEIFIGSESCAGCHQSQHELWQQSHHRHAFAPANSNSVIGDFSSVAFNYAEGIAIFEQQKIANKIQYQIRLKHSQASLKEQVYPVVYTLGIFPLQQYIVETRPGNYQVFAVAWDARATEQGGQRWMDLSSSGQTDDPLHWRHYFQNWNSQCASCHTTNFASNISIDVNREHPIFDSSWSEPAVGCESCHGPASEHIKWSEDKLQDKGGSKGLIRQLANADNWQFVADEPIARRVTSTNETVAMPVIDGCANCHSLRQPISEYSHETTQTDWLNNFEPTRVREPLYFADGQIREEVFVYGSFAQSKMSHAGVTCLNCHDAHNGRVNGFDDKNLALPSNDAVCAQCHRADVFAVESHHHHPIESEAARCVTCHMPERIYMAVDPRRDHSFQKPSPALSQLVGTPNVCTQCHKDNTDAWAAEQLEQWHPSTPDENQPVDFADWMLSFARLNTRFSEASNTDQAALSDELIALENQRYALLASSKTPAMKKSMLLDSMPINSQQAFDTLVARLSDDDAIVRLAAIAVVQNFDAASRQQLLTPLLKDPIKSVRFAATLALADLLAAPNFNNEQTKMLLKDNVMQYIAAYKFHGDLLGSQIKLADMYRQLQDWDGVIEAYQKALKLVPSYVLALVNLADVYRLQQQDSKAEQLLLKAVAVTRKNAEQSMNDASDVHQSALQQQASVEYALGLLYARSKNYSKASVSLDNAARLSPQNADYFYAYLLILDALDQRDKAVDILQASPLTPSNKQLMALLQQWQP